MSQTQTRSSSHLRIHPHAIQANLSLHPTISILPTPTHHTSHTTKPYLRRPTLTSLPTLDICPRLPSIVDVAMPSMPPQIPPWRHAPLPRRGPQLLLRHHDHQSLAQARLTAHQAAPRLRQRIRLRGMESNGPLAPRQWLWHRQEEELLGQLRLSE